MARRRTAQLGAALALTALAALAAGAALGLDRLMPDLAGRAAVAAGLALVAGAGLWLGQAEIRTILRDITHLRGALRVKRERPDHILTQGIESADAILLASAIEETLAVTALKSAKPDERLATVLSSLDTGLAVVTEDGFVSLINPPALGLLGAEAARVGTSIFAALEYDSLSEAMSAADAAGTTIKATLHKVTGAVVEARIAPFAEHGGYVLTFPEAGDAAGAVEHDLGLHDTLPPARPFGPETPLAELPVAVFDMETTGLDVRRDRPVSAGGVAMRGTRIYTTTILDILVHPGMPIPPASTRIHGITDAMVAGVPDFAGQWPVIRGFLEGCVVVGHSVAFDMALLRAEAARLRIELPKMPTLCTALLCAALFPDDADVGLEAVAAKLGVSIRGRHTALGDCLVTADVFAALVHHLAERGITTLGQAQAFAAKAKGLVAQQKQAGW